MSLNVKNLVAVFGPQHPTANAILAEGIRQLMPGSEMSGGYLSA